jgi:hypothetical protein
MFKVESSVVVQRPLADVFEYMTIPENDIYWQAGVLTSKKTSPGPIGVGTLEESESQYFGQRVKSTFEVSVYEPNRKIEYKTTSGPFHAVASYDFASLADGGTKVDFLIELEGASFFKIAEPILGRMTQRQWDTNTTMLKEILEAEL